MVSSREEARVQVLQTFQSVGSPLAQALEEEFGRPSWDTVRRVGANLLRSVAEAQQPFLETFTVLQKQRDEHSALLEIDESRLHVTRREAEKEVSRNARRRQSYIRQILRTATMRDLRHALNAFLSVLGLEEEKNMYIGSVETSSKGSGEVLRYFAASSGQAHLIGQELPRGVGVVWQCIDESDGEVSEVNDMASSSSLTSRFQFAMRDHFLERRKNSILRVFRTLDMADLHFFDIPRAGEFIAVCIPFVGPPNLDTTAFALQALHHTVERRKAFEREIEEEKRNAENVKEAEKRAAEEKERLKRKTAIKSKPIPAVEDEPDTPEDADSVPEAVLDTYAADVIEYPPCRGGDDGENGITRWVVCADSCRSAALPQTIQGSSKCSASDVALIEDVAEQLKIHAERASMAAVLSSARISFMLLKGILPLYIAAADLDCEQTIRKIIPFPPKDTVATKSSRLRKAKEVVPETFTEEQQQEIFGLRFESQQKKFKDLIPQLLALRPAELVGHPECCDLLFEATLLILRTPPILFAAPSEIAKKSGQEGSEMLSMDWKRIDSIWTKATLERVIETEPNDLSFPLSSTRVVEIRHLLTV